MANNNYKGFIGCEFPEKVKAVEDYINDWYIRNDMGNFHFSADGNSREYFFTNASHWLMKLIAIHQDLWCNNKRYHPIIKTLKEVHALAYTPSEHESANVALFYLYNMIEEFKEEL